MNRLAEKILPILNDQEVDELVIDHYKSESQTLTTGAEANLLKFKEMFSLLSQEEEVRWNEIKKTLKRNQLLGSADQSDPVGRVVAQLTSFQEGLGSIQTTLEQKLNPEKTQDLSIDLNPLVEQLGCIGEKLASSMTNSVAGNLKKNEQQASLELTSEINNKFELIKNVILKTTLDELCLDLPAEFIDIVSYTRQLRFDEQPGYSYIRKRLTHLFQREGFVQDYDFDWKST
jgi:hypothetical protein